MRALIARTPLWFSLLILANALLMIILFARDWLIVFLATGALMFAVLWLFEWMWPKEWRDDEG